MGPLNFTHNVMEPRATSALSGRRPAGTDGVPAESYTGQGRDQQPQVKWLKGTSGLRVESEVGEVLKSQSPKEVKDSSRQLGIAEAIPWRGDPWGAEAEPALPQSR